ncbi:MAG: UxaA family hydrolase [Rhodothalassiaceae bacterium]
MPECLDHCGKWEEWSVNAPHLLVHDKKDNVGVVVVEDLAPGTEMLCVVTADNSDFRLRVIDPVPIGHKVALRDLAVGDSVIKYGEDIGRIVAPVKKGGHVHVHNLKTRRW